MDLRHSGLYLAVFSFIGVILVGVFGVALVPGFDEALQAGRYTSTPGTLTSYQRFQVPSGRGQTTWESRVTYTYTVGAQPLTGSRVTLFDDLTSDAATGLGFVTIGMPVAVWYDPTDPSTAALETRIPRGAFFMLIGFAMFAGMAIVFWIDAIDAVLWRAQRRPAGGVFVQSHHGRFHIRLPRHAPATLAALAVFFLAMALVIGVIIAAFSGGVPPFPGWRGWICVALLLVSGLVVYLFTRYRVRSGQRDLILNPGAGLITLPPTFGRGAARIIPIPAIRDIRVEVREHEAHTQYGTVQTSTHLPTLTWKSPDGRLHNETLAEWTDSGKAFAFVKWLNARLVQSELGKRGVGRGNDKLPSVLEGIYD